MVHAPLPKPGPEEVAHAKNVGHRLQPRCAEKKKKKKKKNKGSILVAGCLDPSKKSVFFVFCLVSGKQRELFMFVLPGQWKTKGIVFMLVLPG